MTTITQIVEITNIATDLVARFGHFEKDETEIISSSVAEDISRIALFVCNLTFESRCLEYALERDEELFNSDFSSLNFGEVFNHVAKAMGRRSEND